MKNAIVGTALSAIFTALVVVALWKGTPQDGIMGAAGIFVWTMAAVVSFRFSFVSDQS